ncbi:MAG TPA: RDD family protein [Verrucomicrobiae bacterium]|nr:RDD family protein [Verrucomicrobiae bacterium]
MYCSKCGAVLVADAAFCTSCGSPVVRAALAGAAGAAVPANMGVAGFSTTRSVMYAGFWLRFVAHLIDGLILGVGVFALVIPLLFLTGLAATLASLPHRLEGMEGQPNPAVIGAILSLVFMFVMVGVLLQWLYYAYLESGEKQATWGKQALGLYVTDGAANRISFGRASGRFFAKIISALIPLWIGYIMAGFTEKKQALHDMIAGCLVLRR